MRTTTKAKAVLYYGKFSRYTTMANPKLAKKFLKGVRFYIICPHDSRLIHTFIIYDSSSISSNYKALEHESETRDDF
jgi:hypothetical protein